MSVSIVSRVIYKPDHEKIDEFMVIVNLSEYKKWREGDKSIPLTQVVDSFRIFYSGQGSQGILGAPSNQQLDNCFNTHDDVEVIKTILEKGKEQPAEVVRMGFNSTNATRGTAVMGEKGRGNVI